jgi:hypothetical protein
MANQPGVTRGMVDKDDAGDLARMFLDPSKAPGITRNLVGAVTEVTSCDLEPGYLEVTVREPSGTATKVILNSSARVRMGEGARLVRYGSAATDIKVKMRFSGSVREVALRQFDTNPQVFALEATLSR